LLADWLAGWTEGDVREISTKRSATLHRLSARGIQAAGEGDHADGGGLMLRVRGASASWVYRFTSPTGRRREMGLGVAHRGSTAQAGESVTIARRLAHDAREQLARGLDPIDERDKAREAAQQQEAAKKAEKVRERWTLARWARAYHERVIEPTKTDKHSAQWISSLENHVPASIWHKPIDAIEPPELLQAMREIRPHERARRHDGDSVPETVQRIRQRLEAVFEDAIFHKRCTMNPAAAIKRKMREEQPARDRGRFAALPYREAPALMAELRRQEGIAARCLEFAVLTTARTSEALLAEWSEFDLAAGLWSVPAAKMKAKEPHVVYLSPRVLAIVEAQSGLDPVYLFPWTASRCRTWPCSTCSAEWACAIARPCTACAGRPSARGTTRPARHAATSSRPAWRTRRATVCARRTTRAQGPGRRPGDPAGHAAAGSPHRPSRARAARTHRTCRTVQLAQGPVARGETRVTRRRWKTRPRCSR
jgi:integrase